jgi:diguanylate cyclase (GGDEF)-like protein/PAS domain S-box-containing protein
MNDRRPARVFFTGLSIRTRLLVLIASVLAIAMVAATAFIRHLVKDNITNHARQTADILTASLVHDIKYEWRDGDRDTVAVIIDKYMTYYRVIESISFYDANLSSVADSVAERVGQTTADPDVLEAVKFAQPLTRVVESDRRILNIHSIAPILLGSKIVGAVVIKISIRDIHATLSAIDRRILVILIVTVLTAAIVSFVILRASILPRLSRLMHAARQIAAGNYEVGVGDVRRDEIGALGATIDQMIRDLKGQREQLVDKQYVDSVIANMMNCLIVIDAHDRIKTVNRATLDLLGYDESELIGQPRDLLLPDVPVLRDERNGRVDKDRALSNIELNYLSKDGTVIPVIFSGAVMRNAAGEPQGMVCVAQDLRDRKKAEVALATQAMRDSLTDLYNRRYFDQWIRGELAKAERHDKPLAVLLCDLDRFKSINDTMGHQAGDEVLRLVARAMLDSVRGIDQVFRWGGDELMAVLPETTREGAHATAERIRKKIRDCTQSRFPDLDVSIGIAFYPDYGSDPDELVRVADLALYLSKKSGEKIHVGADEYEFDRHSAKVTFRPSIVVQPIVDIRSGQIIGHEALSRDPTGRLSIEDVFRRYDVIGRLHEIKRLCFENQLDAVQGSGLPCVFLNVDFRVLSAVTPTPAPRGPQVILEISELDALHDIEQRLAVTTRWRELGYRFAIDDFGAGFVSLPFIARLMPEYIKLDRSTILHAVAETAFKEFITNLVTALHSYAQKGIIAEGIETEEEIRIAEEMGVYLVQGFLVGEPVPIAGHRSIREAA